MVEAELGELTRQAVSRQRLSATQDAQMAVHESAVTLICVATPSRTNGDLDFSYLEKVCTEIGGALATKAGYHVVVVRSTVLPGTLRGLLIPLLERHSGRKAGTHFGVCNNPEFLREGSAVHDFRNPPKTVIGSTDPRSADVVASLYEGLPGPVIRWTLSFSITILTPPKVGVLALPSETGKLNICLPSEVTVIRSVLPSILLMFAGPVDTSRLRLLSKTRPVPADCPLTGRSR